MGEYYLGYFPQIGIMLYVRQDVRPRQRDVQGAGHRHDLRWQNRSILGIFVVSNSGFTEDALAVAREESIKELFRYPVELVTETPEGYEIPVKD